MSDDLLDAINGRLDYGDSRAAWIREACRQRLEREEFRGDDGPEEAQADS